MELRKNIRKTFSGKRDDILFVTGIIFCIFVFMVSLLRSGMTGITYDEAYTYVAITNQNLTDWKVLQHLFSKEGCIANNHWLNSLLIYAVDRLAKASYSEFVIRVPSLAAFAIYLFYICRYFRKKFFEFPILLLLAGNYYLDEYYGLARGYGMANTFVFLLCLSLIRWKISDWNDMKYLNLAMVLAIFAVLSNTIVLLLYPAVGTVCLYRLISKKRFGIFLKKCGAVFLFFTFISAMMGVYHLRISSEGKPLFTGGKKGFFDCFVKGYLNMFAAKELFINVGAVLIICIITVAFLIRWKGKVTSDAGAMFIIFILTNLIMQAAFQKGYITGRVLLPFYAFIILTISDIIRGAADRFSKVLCLQFIGKAAVIVICAACVFLFIKKINLHATKDWDYDYKYKTMEIGQRMTGKPFDSPGGPEHVFYQEKYHYLIKDYLLLLEEENNSQ